VRVTDGQSIKMEFENLSDKRLYVTVLNLQPLWGIAQVYPAAGDEECGTIDMNGAFPEPLFESLKMEIPTAISPGVPIIDILKVFVTVNDSTSFAFLTQPCLDPTAGRELDPTQGERGAQLKELFDLFGTSYRSGYDFDWATSEIKIQTRRLA
jgi:hypothetical protein